MASAMNGGSELAAACGQGNTAHKSANQKHRNVEEVEANSTGPSIATGNETRGATAIDGTWSSQAHGDKALGATIQRTEGTRRQREVRRVRRSLQTPPGMDLAGRPPWPAA